MQPLITTSSSTWNTNETRQREIAAQCNASDDCGWSYRVEQRGRYFVVVVYDEDGLRLGDL